MILNLRYKPELFILTIFLRRFYIKEILPVSNNCKKNSKGKSTFPLSKPVEIVRGIRHGCSVRGRTDLCERLDVDDVDQSEEEGEPVLHSGHVGQQAALRQDLHHWKTHAMILQKGWQQTQALQQSQRL